MQRENIKLNKLQEWERVTNELATEFINKYFDKDAEYWWVADQIGDVMFINDYFFNLSDMVYFLRYKYSKKYMFNYYEYRLDMDKKKQGTAINIKNWKKLKNKD